MKISVIIPTYNRPRTLLQALCSLQDQTLCDFEILAVDNAADSKVHRMIAEFNHTARLPASYLPEPRLGVHHARHVGARAAKGELLVFTDDDASFDPGLLIAYAKAFAEHPEMAAAGGPVRPIWEVPPPKWLLEFMGDAKLFGSLSLMEPYDEFRLDTEGFFWSVNMAIRRDILFAAGGFHPEATGNIWLGDGETGLNYKLWERRTVIGYVPEAIVYHHIPPQRMTVKYLCRRSANQGAADTYAHFHHGGLGRLRLLMYAARIAIKNGMFWIVAHLVKGQTDARSLHIQLRAARTQSQLKYVIQLMLDEDFQQMVLKEDWLNS